MLALRFHPGENDFILEDNIPIPTIEKDDDVIIKVEYAGLCGTDLHIVQGEFANISILPVTLGHEFSGTVVECGANAVDLKPGTKVAVDPNMGCQQCKVCLDGNYHFCRRNVNVGVKRDGGFARYCVVPRNQVHVLPEQVSLKQGALCEPLSCIFHGWNRLQKAGPLQPDSRILILGAGIIGNLWMSILHHFGQRDVTISEPSLDRRTIAENLGTGYKVTSPSVIAKIMPKSRFEAEDNGMDVIIDCTGVPAALEAALQWTSRGAIVMVFGCAPVGKAMKLCPEEVFAKELTILGTLVNPFTFAKATALVANMGARYINFETLGIGVYSLDNYSEGLRKLRRGNISKVMFRLDDD